MFTRELQSRGTLVKASPHGAHTFTRPGPTIAEAHPQQVCPCGGACLSCASRPGNIAVSRGPANLREDWRRAVHTAADDSGRPLDRASLSSLGERRHTLGLDFSRIRVHTDDAAHEAADRLSARAFTVGSDIFFRRGEYRPAESWGRSLLLHELAHVAQDPVTPISEAWKLPLSKPDDPSERTASEFAKLHVDRDMVDLCRRRRRQFAVFWQPTLRRIQRFFPVIKTLFGYLPSHRQRIPPAFMRRSRH